MINDVDKIEAELKELAKEFTEENIKDPSEANYLLIYNAMLKSWQLGVIQSIAYMKEKGIQLGQL